MLKGMEGSSAEGDNAALQMLLEQTAPVATQGAPIGEAAQPELAAAALPLVSPTSKSLQPRLLKQINQLSTKEELLAYVDHCHHLLDSINLVTVLYRLTRIYSFTQATKQKVVWKAELLDNPSFALLLSVIRSHLTQAQAAMTAQSEIPGINARCICNLVWSIVKLEMASETGNAVAALAVDVVLTATPLVLRLLKDCSGQGLSNLLWSFAKIPASPPSVMTAIVARMVELLESPNSANVLDAQALSNSIWAIAHVRSRPNELDSDEKWQNTVTSFLLLVTHQCLTVLGGGAEGAVGPSSHQQAQTQPGGAAGGGMGGEANDGRFSCQAVVNIAWSFSSILGSACGVQDPVRPLFLLIRQLTIERLNAILGGNVNGASWNSTLTGSFNEQALSNVVYAFDKAQLLNTELLQAVFDMAAVRLSRPSTGSQGPLGFKPQELCTLLRACHTGIAQPWAFLHALSRLLGQYPTATAAWTPAEMVDLHRGLQLLRNNMPAAVQVPVVAPRHGGLLQTGLPGGLNAPQQLLPGASGAGHLLQTSPAHSYATPAHLLNRSGSGNERQSNTLQGVRQHQLLRGESAPESALLSLLQDNPLATDPFYSHGATFLSQTVNPHAISAPHSQGTSLQQVWVLDQAGNLQPTTFVVQQPQMSLQQQQQIALQQQQAHVTLQQQQQLALQQQQQQLQRYPQLTLQQQHQYQGLGGGSFM